MSDGQSEREVGQLAANAPVLRPLTIAEILDAAFRVYRRNFGRLVTVAAYVYVPLAVIQALIAAIFVASVSRMPQPGSAGGVMPTHLLAGIGVGGLLLWILSMVGYMLAYAAMTVTISNEYLGRDISPADAYRRVMPSLGTVIGTSLLVGIVVSIGFMLCVIPGIYLAVAYTFAIPVVVLEGLGATAAMSRSMNLVRGYWFHVFITMFLLMLIIGIIEMAILWPLNMIVVAGLAQASPGLGQALSQLVSALASMVFFPLSMAGLVVLYYDLRVRKEGFDLQLLAQHLGAPAPVVGPGQTPPVPPAAGPAGTATQPPSAKPEAELPPPPGGEQDQLWAPEEDQGQGEGSQDQGSSSDQDSWRDDEPRF